MTMDEKFDPAPLDKHAGKKDRPSGTQEQDLDNGLEDSFPASDPVSAVQPAKRKHAEPK